MSEQMKCPQCNKIYVRVAQYNKHTKECKGKSQTKMINKQIINQIIKKAEDNVEKQQEEIQQEEIKEEQLCQDIPVTMPSPISSNSPQIQHNINNMTEQRLNNQQIWDSLIKEIVYCFTVQRPRRSPYFMLKDNSQLYTIVNNNEVLISAVYKYKLLPNPIAILNHFGISSYKYEKLALSYSEKQLQQQLKYCLYNDNYFMFSIQSQKKFKEVQSYDYRAMTLQQAYELGQKGQNQINQMFGVEYNRIIRLFFDIDIGDKINEQSVREQFINDLIKTVKKCQFAWSKSPQSSVDYKINWSTEEKKSCHIFTNLSIDIHDLRDSFIPSIVQLMAPQYHQYQLEKIIDVSPYCQTEKENEFTFMKQLRFIGSEKFKTEEDEDAEQEEFYDSDTDEYVLKKKYYQQPQGKQQKLTEISNLQFYSICNTQSTIRMYRPFVLLNEPYALIKMEQNQENIEESIEYTTPDQLAQTLFGNDYEIKIDKLTGGSLIYYNQECPICKVTHEQRENRKLIVKQDHNGYSRYCFCFRTKEHQDTCIEKQYIPMAKYRQHFNPVEQQYSLVEQFPVTHNNYRQSFQYDPSTKQYTFVISPCGSGKTYQIREFLKKFPNYRVLFISTRISFTNAQIKDYEKEGITIANYKDFISKDKEMCQEQRLFIEIESLVRLQKSAFYDIVVLDEYESIIKQLNNKGLKNMDRQNIKNILESVINNSQYCLIIDAFLSKVSYHHFLNSYQNTDDHQIINNIYQPYKNLTCQVYTNFYIDQMIEEIATNLLLNQKTYSCFTSKQTLIAVYDILKTKFDNIYMLNGDNMEEDCHYKGQKHIDAKTELYKDKNLINQFQWIGYTSSLSVGVDLLFEQPRVGIHQVSKQGCDSQTLIQMICRFRNMKAQTIFLDFKDNRPQMPQSNYNLQINKITEELYTKNSLNYIYSYNQIIMTQQNVRDEVLRKAQSRFLSNNKWEYLCAALKKLGFKIEYAQSQSIDKLAFEKQTIKIEDIQAQPINTDDIITFFKILQYGSNYFISNTCTPQDKARPSFTLQFLKINIYHKYINKYIFQYNPEITQQQFTDEILKCEQLKLSIAELKLKNKKQFMSDFINKINNIQFQNYLTIPDQMLTALSQSSLITDKKAIEKMINVVIGNAIFDYGDEKDIENIFSQNLFSKTHYSDINIPYVQTIYAHCLIALLQKFTSTQNMKSYCAQYQPNTSIGDFIINNINIPLNSFYLVPHIFKLIQNNFCYHTNDLLQLREQYFNINKDILSFIPDKNPHLKKVNDKQPNFESIYVNKFNKQLEKAQKDYEQAHKLYQYAVNNRSTTYANQIYNDAVQKYNVLDQLENQNHIAEINKLITQDQNKRDKITKSNQFKVRLAFTEIAKEVGVLKSEAQMVSINNVKLSGFPLYFIELLQ